MPDCTGSSSKTVVRVGGWQFVGDIYLWVSVGLEYRPVDMMPYVSELKVSRKVILD